jgi:hypothetical protein
MVVAVNHLTKGGPMKNRRVMQTAIIVAVARGVKQAFGGGKEGVDIFQLKTSVAMDLEISASNANLLDMVAFIRFCKVRGKHPCYVSGNLLHDISGLSRMETHFVPRTTGYRKLMKEKTDELQPST